MTKDDVKKIVSSLRKLSSFDLNRLKRIEERLNKAVGVSPIEWVKSYNPDLGILTKEEAEKIIKSVKNPKARERMGLEPLKE